LVITAVTSSEAASVRFDGLNKVMSPVAAGMATCGQAERVTKTPP